MKPSIRVVAGYETVAGAASLIAIAALMRPPMLDAWGFVNLGILVLACVTSMVAGVRLWRNPANGGARELSLVVLGVQVPRAVLPGFAWSVTAGVSAFVGLLGASVNISWNAMAFAFVRLGRHDTQFELGVNLVPLLLVIALHRWSTQPAETNVESTVAAG